MSVIGRITRARAIGTMDTNGCGCRVTANMITGFMDVTSAAANFIANTPANIITITNITTTIGTKKQIPSVQNRSQTILSAGATF